MKEEANAQKNTHLKNAQAIATINFFPLFEGYAFEGFMFLKAFGF
jgi:hypothetical protein